MNNIGFFAVGEQGVVLKLRGRDGRIHECAASALSQEEVARQQTARQADVIVVPLALSSGVRAAAVNIHELAQTLGLASSDVPDEEHLQALIRFQQYIAPYAPTLTLKEFYDILDYVKQHPDAKGYFSTATTHLKRGLEFTDQGVFLHCNYIRKARRSPDKTVGEGSFKLVRLAIHLRTGERQAVSKLSHAMAEELSCRQQFEQELAFARRFSQEDVGVAQALRVIEIPAHDQKPAKFLLISPLYKGDLFHNDHYLPLQKQISLIKQLIQGIAAIEKKGIIHRDIKSDNILLDQAGDPKITDFGLSCSIENAGAIKEPRGTPGYLPPEYFRKMLDTQASNVEGLVQPKVDTWALGIVLWELLLMNGRGRLATPLPLELHISWQDKQRMLDQEEAAFAGQPQTSEQVRQTNLLRQWRDEALLKLYRTIAQFSQEVLEKELRNSCQPIPTPLRNLLFDCLETDPLKRPSPKELETKWVPLLDQFLATLKIS